MKDENKKGEPYSAEPRAPKCQGCNGTGSSGGRMHSNGIDEPEYERFKCETCDGFGATMETKND